VEKEAPAQLVPKVNPVRLVPLANRAAPAKTVAQVQLVVQATKAPLAVPEKLAALAQLEIQAKMAHPAVANTARQLVWLQVIKRQRHRQRAPSQAARQRCPLGRWFDKFSCSDKKDHFVHERSFFSFLITFSSCAS